jgi:putative GTP pyrophosphokinase
MKPEYTGPRYEKIGDLRFEIQVRSLCMHCWAAVSHHVDYKGDWDVPMELKTSLNALAGLFYVADNEFQAFYSARTASKKRAETETTQQLSAEDDINLDTFGAYLRRRFPDRAEASRDYLSDLIREIKRTPEYTKLSLVARDIDRAAKAFTEFEKENAPRGKYADIAAARLSLGIANEHFRIVLRRPDLSNIPTS